MNNKEKSLRVRLSKEEHQKLEKEAKKAGYNTISDFVRYVTIGEGRAILEKLDDLKEIISRLK